MKRGFTLIELLVVVLIIGILAAIALPQYQKAVERSRIAEAIQALGDTATAQSVYYLNHNEFATGLDTLNGGDVQVNDAGDSWFDMRFNAVSRNGLAGQSMLLMRSGGIYQYGVLEIAVFADGSIAKICTPPFEKEEFCAIAQSEGYGDAEAANVTHSCNRGCYWAGTGCECPQK